MKSSYKTAYSVGAVALVLAGAAHAEPSKSNFDNFTVNSGVITAGCPAGAYTSCGAALTDNGFLTRLVVDSSTGKQFFQTIVTMPNATATTPADVAKLDFSDENFVSYNNNSGIIDKQRINQSEVLPIPLKPPHTVNFTNGSIIGTGWAKDFVELTQSISDPTATGGDGFQTDFIYKQVGYVNEPAGQYAKGKGMKITSYVPIVGTDKQDFVLVEKSGNFVTAPGSVTLTGPKGGTVTWAPGTNTGAAAPTPRIQGLYIGEKLDVAGQLFGLTTYNNFTTPATISTFSLSSTAASEWDTGTWGDLNTVGVINDPFMPVP